MKKGIYLIFFTAVISGFAVFFNKFGLEAIGKDSGQYTFLKNGITALILSLLILTPIVWKKVRDLEKKDLLKLVLIGLIGGSIPFLLFFKGLSMSSPVNAAFLHKTLFIWAAILAWPLLKEKIRGLQFLALIVLLLGVIVFCDLKSLTFGWAEIMILGATFMWAVESIIAKVALRKISSVVLAWGRMFFGSLILIVFLFLTGNVSGLLSFDLVQMSWLLLVGVFLAGYVLTWYGSLKRLPVTVVSSVLVLAFPITALLNSIFAANAFSLEKILGSIIILSGTFLFLQIKDVKNPILIKNEKSF